MDHTFLFNTFVFLAAACIVVPLASRFKLGSVLGYLAAGILIGPFGLGFIHNPKEVMHFAEFGVVMMLFVIGLELEPSMLWRMRKSIIGLGGLQVLLTTAAFAGLGLAFGLSWQIALTIGMALSLSSTALVLQMLQEKKLMQTSLGESAFSVLLFQDIAVIPILIILPLLALHGGAESLAGNGFINALPGWAHALLVAAVIALVIGAGRHLSHHFFQAIAKTNLREVFTATSLAVVVGVTLLMQSIGISPALGAFIAGVVLANSYYRRTLETDIEPFKGLLLGLFFISIGMGMDFSILTSQPAQLAAIVIMLISVKALILLVLARGVGMGGSYGIGFALALAQGGEFAFVLFQYAGMLEILPPELNKLLTLSVAASIACTPVLMLLYSRLIIPRFMSAVPEREYDKIHEKNPVIIVGFGRFGQIIGRFIMGQGVGVTVLEKDPEQIEMLRKFHFKGYFGDASRLDLLRSAGGDQAKLLVIAVNNIDECLEIARMVTEEFPNLKIFARARNRRHAYELHKLGVSHFRRDTFDASLAMAQDIMVALGHKKTEMQHKAERFKKHDEDSLRKSFAFFDNENDMIDFSRMQRAEMEQILREDVRNDEEKNNLSK